MENKKMLNVTETLHYKAEFKIGQRKDSKNTLLYEALLFIYEYVTFLTGWNVSFEKFQKQKVFESDGCIVKIANQAPVWAIKIEKHDDKKRRKWITHIQIQCEMSNTLYLRYAQYYRDYSWNAFMPLQAPDQCPPVFIQNLVCDETLICAVGAHPLPSMAIEIDDTTIKEILDLLYDPQRNIPIIILTCPQSIDAALMAKTTLGNTIIYYTSNVQAIKNLNESLSEYLQVRGNSMHIYLPTKNGAVPMRPISSQTLNKYNNHDISQFVYNAYCICMTNEERKRFLTVDDIQQQSLSQKQNESARKIGQIKRQLDELTKENTVLREERENHLAKIAGLERIVNCEPISTVVEYEKAWSDCRDELEDVIRQVEELTNALFSGVKPALNSHSKCVAIAQLVGAMNFLLDPPSRNGNIKNAKK
jgi:regulator of replication initiation timing